MMEELKEFEGKKVFIELKTGRRYTGIVKEVSNDFIKLRDIYNALVYIHEEEIVVIQEEKN